MCFVYTYNVPQKVHVRTFDLFGALNFDTNVGMKCDNAYTMSERQQK